MSPTVVSLFLKNKYKGDCLSVTNKVVGLIRQARREEAKRRSDEVRSRWLAMCYLRCSSRRIIGLHDQLELAMEGIGVVDECANRTAELEQQVVEELSRMEQAVKIVKRKMSR